MLFSQRPKNYNEDKTNSTKKTLYCEEKALAESPRNEFVASGLKKVKIATNTSRGLSARAREVASHIVNANLTLHCMLIMPENQMHY